MSLKQFLKPDKKKKIVFIIIAISFFILYSFIQQLNKDACLLEQSKNGQSIHIPFAGESSLERLCNANLLSKIMIINPAIDFLSLYEGTNRGEQVIIQIPDANTSDFSSGMIVYLMFFSLSFPYIYVISCLIVWIYDKLKKK